MKKLLKRMFSLVITLAMTFNMFAPLAVYADPATYTFTFTVEDSTLFTITKQGNDEIKVERGGDNPATSYIVVQSPASHNKIAGTTVSCNSNECTVTVPVPDTPNHEVNITYATDQYDITTSGNNGQLVDPSNIWTADQSFVIKEFSGQVPNVPTGSLTFIFNTSDGSGFELFKDNDSRLKIKDTQNNNDIYGVDFAANSAEGTILPTTVTCENTKLSCTAVVGTDDSVKDVRIVIGGGSESDFNLMYDDNGKMRAYYGNERGFTSNDTLTVKRKPLTYRFDGKAFFIWECSGKANSTCYHEITGLPVRDEQHPELDMNYIVNTAIVADNNPSEVFNPANYNPRKTGFTYSTAMNGWRAAYVAETDGVNSVNDIDYTKIDPEFMLEGRMDQIEEEAIRDGKCERTGDPSDMEYCLQEEYNLTAVDKGIRVFDHAEQGDNSYVTFGDNEFKITIYNDDYAGLKVDESEQTHTVDGLGSITPDAVDISGSTLNNPAEIKTLILEDTLTVRSVHSAPYKKVEALKTPEGAIDINVVDGVAVIKFNSNYYDRTVFKFTTVDDEVYYVKFIRRSIDVEIYDGNQFYDKDNIYLEVSFYFDEATSHSDYEVLVSPVKKDGTVEAPIVMKNLGKIDRGGANITTADEIMIGRRTKKSVFYYDIRDDRDGEKVINEYQGYYINVRKKGSTDTNYAGTFAGNGKGLFFVLDVQNGPHLVY